ncbi:spore germination protein [Clostridium sporogenes]|nr:spore germination protein [Clostridium sporogenes]
MEDYTQRTIISSFTRLLRYFAVFIVTTLPAIYIIFFIKFNLINDYFKTYELYSII